MGSMQHVTSFWSLGFFEIWHPVMLIILIGIGWLYIHSVRAKEPHYSMTKLIFFLCGLLLFYIAEGSPLKAFGHHFLFSAHMLSMSITYFAVPPLILGGLYGWMVDPLVNNKGMRKFINKITHPLLAVSLFNILLSFYHVPIIFNHIMMTDMGMLIADIILLFFAFVMWWLIVQPTVKTRSLSQFQKIGYVFAASVLLTPCCAMIMFAQHFIYVMTANEPQVFSFLPPLDDQQTGGVVMKIIQEIVFVGTIGYIIYQWSKQEHDPEANNLNPKANAIRNNK